VTPRQFEAEADLEEALIEYFRAYGLDDDAIPAEVDACFRLIEADLEDIG
jgi:hypothetical protein